MFLRDIQLEDPIIISRWLLSEPAGSNAIADDVGGVQLVSTGTPTLGLPTLCDQGKLTSAQGGYSTQLDGFAAPVAAFLFESGVTLEGATARDPHGVTFNLFNAPGQAQLQIAGANVVFTVWTSASHALTATGVIIGYPQHIIGIYDPVAQLQQIYVDGALVASQALSGSVAVATTGNTQILVASSSSACVALGQDVAAYNGPLSVNRVVQHFQAFGQIWPDPGHALTYTKIGVTK